MKKIIFLLVSLLAFATSALAQIPQAPMPLYFVPAPASRIEGMIDVPRAVGPSLQVAIDLAQAAFEACEAMGYKASVLVTDSTGVPIVLLSGDGAGERAQLITHTKALTVVTYGMSSLEVQQRANEDPEFAEELARNPNIGVARGGGMPLMRDGELIGALAVAGGANIPCAEEAMESVPLN